MSNKNSRTASPSSPQQNVQTSKLPRFLQKAAARDRSKSVTDPNSQASSPPSSPTPEIQSTPNPGKTPRKATKFLGMRDKEDKKPPAESPPETEETPVIVEPVTIPRARTRADRPINSVPDSTMYSSTPSSSRIGDLPTRLSGWFSHTFSSSSTDLALPTILATHTSPKGKSNPLLTAAKHGRGHLDKAVRYLLDSDSTPDKCTDPIWLLGVQHPGYEPSNPATPPNAPMGHHTSGSPNSFRSSTSSVASLSSSNEQAALSQSQTSQKHNPAANWPPVFYNDFTSRIWLTYRSQFPQPIKDGRLSDLCGSGAQAQLTATPSKRTWTHWVGGEKTWSSDSGWGCMLRTGQSLLANALVHIHLGREWRKPPYPVNTADYATYVHILTWFLDTPAPEAPFSVHRMALAGKELGTDVGQWFGPSVAAGAIKQLVNGFPEAGVGVGVAVDGVVYQTDVFAASHGDHYGRTPRRHKRSWGDRQVLVLVGIRLGIDGVNPIYYETIKALYTFPQSVGIAGGRPGSSYYFVGAQADNLFYLDPHHARPAIPLRSPPPGTFPFQQREGTPERVKSSPSSHRRLPTSPSSTRTASSTFSYHAPVSPSPLQQQLSTSSNETTSSTTTDSDAEIYISSRSPPPTLHTPPPPPASSSHHGRWRSASHPPASPGVSDVGLADLTGLAASTGLDPVQLHYCTAYGAAELKTFHCDRVRKMPLSGLDPSMLLGFLVRDEADWADLRTRISGLPRTIFAVQDEPPSWPSDSEDDMGLLSISEPDDVDIEDDEDGDKVAVLDDEDDDGRVDMDGDEEDDEQYFDTRSASASSPSLSSASGSGSQGRPYQKRQQQQDGDKKTLDSERSKSEDNDTEEDPVDPVTPGPHSRFSIIDLDSVKKGVAAEEARARRKAAGELGPEEDSDGEGTGDIEDDWVEPSIPTPMPQHTAYPMGPSSSTSSSDVNERQRSPRVASSSSHPKSRSHGTSSSGVKKSRKNGKKQVPVPVPSVRGTRTSEQEQEHYPFPVTAAASGGEDEDEDPEEPHSFEEGRRTTASTMKAKRMHNARAKDGGRTQSGGVKGLLVDDL